MSASDSRSLRMVIQQRVVEPAYHVVVYGDLEKPKHADFNTRQNLLEALRTTLPDFDISSLCLDPLQRGEGTIVFAGEIVLNDQQLGLLGLI